MNHGDLGELADALQALAGRSVRTGVALVAHGDPALLHPEERTLLGRSVARRRCELAAGRVLLRTLMDRDVPILRAATGAPCVPAEFRASLAHDAEIVVAAVTDDDGVAAVGIDVEPRVHIDAQTAAEVLRPDERGTDPCLAFVLKEAAYKAWSTMGGRFLEHGDVRVRVDGDTFTATVVADEVTLSGRHASVADRWLALVVEPSTATAAGSRPSPTSTVRMSQEARPLYRGS